MYCSTEKLNLEFLFFVSNNLFRNLCELNEYLIKTFFFIEQLFRNISNALIEKVKNIF